jgi:hypothetical protein
MNSKHAFIAAGAAGILCFILWVWRSRRGRWFRWEDPFALLLLAGWLTVCFGFFHWELGYMGYVTDPCGYALPNVFVSAEGVKFKPPKTQDAALPAGAYRTDAEGRFQVLHHFRWTHPFTETPLVWPDLKAFKVTAPGICSFKVLPSKEKRRLSVKIQAMATGLCSAKAGFYPREKEGLTDEEKEQLTSAAKRIHRLDRRGEAVLEGANDDWCEFMELWGGLQRQVGPQAMCRFLSKLKKESPTGPDLQALCGVRP